MKLFIFSLIFIFNLVVNGQNYLLGYLSASRKNLLKKGIDLNFVYTGEGYYVADCDLHKKTTTLHNIDLTATFDFEKILGWKNTFLFVYILGDQGGAPNDRVGRAGRYGTIQGISNISAPDTWKLYQFWIEKSFWGNQLSLLFGLYDLNSEFDVRETSGIFINPSHGIGAEYSQTGKNGPSIFPNTSLAFRIKYQPNRTFYFLLGLFDGVPGDPNNPKGTHIIINKNDGLLISYEMGLFENGEDYRAGYGKYSLGTWYYTGQFEDISAVDENGNPIMRNDNWGIYISAEKFLISEKDDPTQGIAAFLRFGIANGNINAIDYYWGCGITVTGLIPTRDADVLGVAIGNAHAGNKFISANGTLGIQMNKNETIVEITYSYKLNNWLSFQPDYQYVINPMRTFPHQNSNIFGTRIQIIF